MPKTFTLSHPALGPAIRFLRRRARMSQQDLRSAVKQKGGKLGQAWLSRIETGKVEPSERLVDQILAALGSDRYELSQLLEMPVEDLEAAAEDPQGSSVSSTWSAPVAAAAAMAPSFHLVGPQITTPGHEAFFARHFSFLGEPLAAEPSPTPPPLAEATTEFIETYEELDDAGRQALVAHVRSLRSSLH